MAKKLLSVWLSLTILLISSISIYAEETVTGTFFFRDIRINGTQILNYELNHPLFLYDSTTYIPLSPGLQATLGLRCEMDWESRTLKVLKTEITKKQVKDSSVASDMQSVIATVVEDVKVITYTEEAPMSGSPIVAEEDSVDAAAAAEMAAAEKEAIGTPSLRAHTLDLEGFPVLMSQDVIYLPLKALTDDPNLGISIYYESYSGVYISSDPKVDARTYWDEARSKYNKGLVSYIRKYNNSVSVPRAQELVALFQHEAKVYGLDDTLLLSIAHKESNFNVKAKSRGGAAGIMQIMPRTAAGFGVKESQLYNAHTNINLGARLVSGQLKSYNNDMTKALSAYNQGSGSVNRGSYSTKYATRVLNEQAALKNYLTSNGYGMGK